MIKIEKKIARQYRTSDGEVHDDLRSAQTRELCMLFERELRYTEATTACGVLLSHASEVLEVLGRGPVGDGPRPEHRVPDNYEVMHDTHDGATCVSSHDTYREACEAAAVLRARGKSDYVVMGTWEDENA